MPEILRTHRWLLLALLLSGAVMLLVPESAMPTAANRVAAVAVLMAVLWVSEAIPIPVTALLPLVLFPLLDVTPLTQVTGNYAHHLVFLFLGGFWLAAAVEHSGLHRRIALHVLRLVGSRIDLIVLGFMSATAFLSMWLSNTATTMMMLPIALAVVARLGKESPQAFARVLMLGLAYAASIGGVATLVGSPPNAVLAGVAQKTLGIEIGFGRWLMIGLPLSLLMLPAAWWYLTRVNGRLGHARVRAGHALIRSELHEMGRADSAEKRVLAVFAGVAFLWIFKGLIPLQAINELSDSTIAIAGAVLLFILPDGSAQARPLLDWPTAAKIPWDILILFGGGFALAQGFQDSGLTGWIGQQMDFLSGSHAFVLLVVVAVITLFLTEITSNTATASMLLPVVAGIASAAGHDALAPMIAAALAASFAFMLPVATPPNAIVFASRQLSIAQMARAGLWMNLAGIVVICALVWFLVPASGRF
jgi:sodium-dependent dicarboxylate transporter 2/3/5